MRVLLTGCTGHVGAAAAVVLKAAGHEVVGLARRPPGHSGPLSQPIGADLGHPGLAEMLLSEQPRCEAIVHAGASLDRDPHASAISLTNCLGTQGMLELAAAWKVTSFIFISGVTVVGRPLQLPITEEHPTDPPTPYLASKLYGEQLAAIARREGTPTLSLRLTSPVGPGMPDDRILSVFVHKALAGDPLEVKGQGSRCQDYVDVRDVAAAIASSLERGATGTLNIASGSCISNLDLARLCVAVLGSSSEIRTTGELDPEEGTRWEVSIASARSSIAYRPRFSLEESMSAVADETAQTPDA